MESVDTRAEDVIQALRNEVPCGNGSCGGLVQVEDVTVEEFVYCDTCRWYMEQEQFQLEEEEHRHADERRRRREEEEATR